jgi:glycerol-3-phosphate O-acyltransferase
VVTAFGSGDEHVLAREVAERLASRAIRDARQSRGKPLDELLGETLYQEALRLEHSHAPRDEEDRRFLTGIRRGLRRADPPQLEQLVREVARRDTEEIDGHFDPRVYAAVTRALPFALSALLNGLSPADFLRRFGRIEHLEDRLHIHGEVDTLLALATRGTIVLAPTHTSNLDSVLMGYAIYRMGLPPFAYGAGLNLFSNPLIGYFMRHLGAYTIDRLKTDSFYRAAVKEYTSTLLEHGQHVVFFPGGTRSRSGAVERHLKKGLLGAAIAASEHLGERGAQGRIFVVPCTLSYPLVLEAETLIQDYLRSSGRGRYVIEDDEFSQVRRWIDFFLGLLTLYLNVEWVVGRALDPFGNEVDAQGVAHDASGRPVDSTRYLLVDGRIEEDPARDAEYTTLLADRILATYQRDTVALPTSTLAFAFFELLRRRSGVHDLYRLLRLLPDAPAIPFETVRTEVIHLVDALIVQGIAGRIRLAPEIANRQIDLLLANALRTFGTYHSKPVMERRGDLVHVGDARLIFYYRNRLAGRGLLGSRDFLPPGRA